MMSWELWWIWAVAGLLLAIVEVIVPGYIFLGFAIGAIATGVIMLIGLNFGGLPAALAFFAVASLAAWYTLRRVLGIREGQVKIWDRDINDN